MGLVPTLIFDPAISSYKNWQQKYQKSCQEIVVETSVQVQIVFSQKILNRLKSQCANKITLTWLSLII